jgi:hypothetical protein
MITAEMIQERLNQLRVERDQMQRNLYAYDGAIQDCVHWLDLLVTGGQEAAESTEG